MKKTVILPEKVKISFCKYVGRTKITIVKFSENYTIKRSWQHLQLFIKALQLRHTQLFNTCRQLNAIVSNKVWQSKQINRLKKQSMIVKQLTHIHKRYAVHMWHDRKRKCRANALIFMVCNNYGSSHNPPNPNPTT